MDATETNKATEDTSYRSQLKAMLGGDESPPAPKEEKKEDETEEEGDTDEPGDEEEAEAKADDAEAETDPELEDEEGKEKEPETKYSKALLKLQKQEKEFAKHKQAILAKEKAIAEREEKFTQSERELTEFVNNIKHDPFTTLLKYGLVTEKDIGYIAKQLHLMDPENIKDPRYRAEAERMRQQRALEDEIRTTKQKLEQAEKERQDERRRAAEQAEVEGYVKRLDSAVESYKSKNPVLVAALAKQPERTMRELRRMATEMSEAKQEWEDPKLVVLAWTKARKELLEAHGLQVPGAPKEQDKKAKSKSAGEQNGQKSEEKTDNKAALDAEEAYRKELRRRLRGEE